MVNLLHGNYETSIFEIWFHGFPKLFEEKFPRKNPRLGHLYASTGRFTKVVRTW